MIKSELLQCISSANPDLYERDIEKLVNAMFDEITEALLKGWCVEIRGFGAFSVRTDADVSAAIPVQASM